MAAALMENGVSLHPSTYREHVKRALANGCIGLDPQRNGGQALPSPIEKDIAKKVMHLRERQFPVFPDDIRKWAAEAIEGTAHTAYFTNGRPTSGWYQGWLRRMEFLTGHLRPLEQTRA